jgi:hypothetical protein
MRSWRTILGGGLCGAEMEGFWDRKRRSERPRSKAKFCLPGLDAFIEIPAAKVKGIYDPYHP